MRPAGLFLSPPPATPTSPSATTPKPPTNPTSSNRIHAATSIRDEPEAIGPRWLIDWAEVAALHRSQQHALDVVIARERRPQLPIQARLQRPSPPRQATPTSTSAAKCIIMRLDIQVRPRRGQPPRQRTIIRLTRIEMPSMAFPPNPVQQSRLAPPRPYIRCWPGPS